MDCATKKCKQPQLARSDWTSPSATPACVRAPLISLPIEILAEILLNTCSPLTVLAVSRTCSFLYRFLAQNPAASFIWRGVRETCKPSPLPDPKHCWKKTEADYAAFVFGGGVCEVCQKTTRAMYVSFAARIRLCGSWQCRKRMLKESLIRVTSLYTGSLCVPYVESSLCFDPSTSPAITWPDNDYLLLRKADLEKFKLERMAHQAASQIQAKRNQPMASGSLSVAVHEEEEELKHAAKCYDARLQRLPEIMELSARLIHWKYDYDQEYRRTKRQNHAWTKSLAEREGWDLDDLVMSQAYGSLLRRKTSLLEKLWLSDVSSIRSAIESELLAVKVRHNRQKAETNYKEKLTEVKKIYERMRCGTLGDAHTGAVAPSDPTDALILPPLSVFCMLPSVRALKGSPDPSAVPPSCTYATIDIKSSPLATSLIVSDLHTWLVPIQKHLMNLLGYPNAWQSASTRTLHPLKRVTARFFCQRCGEGEVGRVYQRERCLNFKGVCSHVCMQGKSSEPRRLEALQEDEPEATAIGNENGQERGGRRGKKKGDVKTSDRKVEFVKDDKAICLVGSILELTGLSEEDPSTASSLSAKGGIIRCMSCKGWVVMDFDTAIGHTHRHGSMQIQLLATPIPYQVTFPKQDVNATDGYTGRVIPSSRFAFERGISELLLGRSYRARNLCKRINYGCRHCLLVTLGVETPYVKKGAKALHFNGLRSHVKEKHGIQDIRDEDFFCYSSIQNDSR